MKYSKPYYKELSKTVDMRAWDSRKKQKKLWYLIMFFATLFILSFSLKTKCPPEKIISPIPDRYLSPLPTMTPTPTATPTPTMVPLRERTREAQGRWQGYVSHYSRNGCLGCSENLTMANGKTLDDNVPMIAFNWLPMDTKVLITNTDNGKSIVATVTDTGGFNKLGRIADLVPAVANYLETKTDQSLVIIEQL